MIGGEIACELVKRGWSVLSIVRARDDREARSRLAQRLSRSGRSGLLETSRLAALAGDITATDLGLSVEATRAIDLIVHCAGDTSFKADDRCWRINVGAAHRLIELAGKMTRPPRLFFVSTASVCTSRAPGGISEAAEPGGYENGYIRSKRRAEALLVESGLDPVILRPSIVLSRGIRNRRMARSVLWVLPVMKALGEVPVDPHSRLDFVPVDYVADLIGRLIDRERLRHRCYHLSAGPRSSNTCAEIRDTLCRADASYHRLRFVGANSARDRFETSPDAQSLWAALDYYLPFINADAAYSNRRLVEELGPELPPCPPVTQYLNDLMGAMNLRAAAREGLDP